MTKYRATCEHCGCTLGQLALSSGTCTPCWWKQRVWEEKRRRPIPRQAARGLPKEHAA